MIKFGKTWWTAVLMEMTNIVKDRVQKKHQNADGKRFQAYDKKYAERKSEGKTRRKGESQQSYSSKPDMTLTGITMADLNASNINKDGGLIGWSHQGHIVRYLAEHKNYTIFNIGKSNPLGKEELKFFNNQFDKKMKSELKKMAKENSKTIRIKA